MSDLTIDPASTAAVVIDLQHGIVALTTKPSPSVDVVARTASIVSALRKAGGTIVFVRVANSRDGGDALKPTLDAPPLPVAERPANWSEIVPELGLQEGDLVVTKRQWGAFYGTELELQLRRRGIKTLILAGIATNIGVESTARDAYERGFDQIFVDDAMASMSDEGHTFPLKTVFPRMGRVRSTHQVLAALA